MLDGLQLVDAHLHPAHRAGLRVPWPVWTGPWNEAAITELYDGDGALVPEQFAAHLAAEGVDVALMMSEYSPRVTGIQPIEDLLPLAKQEPSRLKMIANVNPHLHFPLVDEVVRQLDLGAVAVKLHPVHAGFAANDRELYPVYELCRARDVPVVVHCGTSTFPGARNAYADPISLDDVVRDFPTLSIVLAHGGRGWWYDAAAFMALVHENVWIELSGLPPKRLPEYYHRHDLARLTRRFIFATDWPAVPSIAGNARAVAALCPDLETTALVLAGNATRVYHLDIPAT